jgi:hypothetical protein
MTSRKLALLLMILLCLPALACGLLSPDATATPSPSTAPPATTPAEATATTAPTLAPPTEAPPTEAPPPEDSDLTTYVSESSGITVQYPSDWAVEDFVFLIIASEEGLLDETTSPDEGGVVVIISNAAEDMPQGTPEEILEASLADLDMGDVAIVDGPTSTEIQGQPAAVAEIAGTADDGTPLEGIVAIVTNEDRVALAMAVTPTETGPDYLPTLEAIVNSIEVGQPTAELPIDDFPTGDTEPAGELVLIAPGDTLAQSIPDDTFQEYSFQGVAGESAVFVVTPHNEEFDVVLELYAAGAPDDLLADIDEGFSGEPEVLEFTPEADGEYILRVRPFFSTAGDYDFYMLDPTAELRFEGFTLENASTATRVCVPAGEPLIAVVIPEDDFDPVLNVSGPDGANLLDFDLDNGASGDAEVLIFDELATGDAPYPVIVVVSGFAGQAGNYILLLGPAGAVIDGC